MLNKLKNIALSLALVGAMTLPLFMAGSVAAQIDDSAKAAACAGLGGAGQGCDDTAGTSVTGLVRTVIVILSWIVGLVSVVMLILGGFKYVVSNGDSNAITSAKNTILYALVGVVVVAVSQILVNFVVTETVTNIQQSQEAAQEE